MARTALVIIAKLATGAVCIIAFISGPDQVCVLVIPGILCQEMSPASLSTIAL